MITLFDKRFTVDYIEGRVIVYLDGVEYIKKKVANIQFDDEIKQEAHRMLSQKFASADKIYSVQDIAEECGVTRAAISLRIPEMIRNLHYLKPNSKTSGIIITEDGRRAIIERMKKTPD